MTNIYAHISDGDAPKSQHVTEVSFVDENGKHVDIGGGGTTEVHTDATLAGTSTTGNPLRLSDDTNSQIAKAGTLTEDNLRLKTNVPSSIPVSMGGTIASVEVCKNSDGNLSLMFATNRGLKKDAFTGGITVLSVPAIEAVSEISTLDSSAALADVINKVNEILDEVKNAL